MIRTLKKNIQEFDEPSRLLSTPLGIFRSLVQETDSQEVPAVLDESAKQ